MENLYNYLFFINIVSLNIYNYIDYLQYKMDKIIRKTIKGYINEYYADQRLPFDDDFYGKKNQMEQYVDWLEDFGKYGNLPPSTLNFKEEVNKALYRLDRLLLTNRQQCPNNIARYIRRKLKKSKEQKERQKE